MLTFIAALLNIICIIIFLILSLLIIYAFWSVVLYGQVVKPLPKSIAYCFILLVLCDRLLALLK